eukprot:1446834-Pleurochrysis_carterae.AAC.2
MAGSGLEATLGARESGVKEDESAGRGRAGADSSRVLGACGLSKRSGGHGRSRKSGAAPYKTLTLAR